MRTIVYESPCGPLLLGEADGSLCMCDWLTANHHESLYKRVEKGVGGSMQPSPSLILDNAVRQLDEYFRGEREVFDIPLNPVGTEFQQRIWDLLLHVGYGETRSYSALAAMAGNPKAVRAVAAAVGANPLSIFIPCHRIVGARGSLTGYAGGLEAKRRLLNLEGNDY